MTLITKGMGVIMKSAMKKAGVTKPTFPGPRAIKSSESIRKRDRHWAEIFFAVKLHHPYFLRRTRPRTLGIGCEKVFLLCSQDPVE
jgi:hypothetical protein